MTPEVPTNVGSSWRTYMPDFLRKCGSFECNALEVAACTLGYCNSLFFFVLSLLPCELVLGTGFVLTLKVWLIKTPF